MPLDIKSGALMLFCEKLSSTTADLLKNAWVCFRIGAHNLCLRNFAAAGEFLFMSLPFSKAKIAA